MSLLSRDQIRGVLVATGVAAAVYAGFRMLPTGTNLSHLDFRPGGSSVEMCDPANPQFIPVVSVRSPVTITLAPGDWKAGQTSTLALEMVSASGKPIGSNDLAVIHTRKLHLLVISPSLADYQHLHPEPGEKPGTWRVDFQPREPGVYRLFADFTPVATGRGLYGYADISVAAGQSSVVGPETDMPGLDVKLASEGGRVIVNKRATLELRFSRANGADVPLETVMDAYAHLVAFDPERLGYAHLHPQSVSEGWIPDRRAPVLKFDVLFPKSGRYHVWAQFKLGGREFFRPFVLEVTP